MADENQDFILLPGRFPRFMMRVARDFKRNQGLLLSGAVAYYTLLSIVPLSILCLIVLSHFMEEKLLLQTLSTYLDMVIPGYARTLQEQVAVFLEHRAVVGVVGFAIMLFFSSIAFSVLENSIAAMFVNRVTSRKRHFIVSVIIPYLYICTMGLGIMLLSFITGAIETLGSRQLTIWKLNISFEYTSRVMLYLLSILGEVAMLTSIYMIMPTIRISFRHALIGGITATALWEVIRRVLVWYYATMSMVNLIYGSFAHAVVTLLCAEAIAIILLFGAQVIAELQASAEQPPSDT